MDTDSQTPSPSSDIVNSAQININGEASGVDGIPAVDGTGMDASLDPSVIDPNLLEPSIMDRAAELLQAGGPVVMILVLMSVFSLAIVVVKLIQFSGARLNDRKPARNALKLWREGHIEEGIAVSSRSRNPVAQAVARGLRGHHRGLPEAMIREEVMRYGGDVLQSMRGWFRPLEVVASLAPLLGLFGTVLGMISAFQQLEAAGNQVNPAILSGGIWVALLTTAAGLAVAMPVVVILNWLERRVDRLAHEMDDCVTQIFTQDLSVDLPRTAATAAPATHPRFRPVPALAGE